MKKIFIIYIACLLAFAANGQTSAPAHRLRVNSEFDNAYIYVSWSELIEDEGFSYYESYTYNNEQAPIDINVPEGTEMTISFYTDKYVNTSTFDKYYYISGLTVNGEEVSLSPILKSNSSCSYVMPNKDVELTFSIGYNSEKPDYEPNTNYWYPETSTLVIYDSYGLITNFNYSEDKEKVLHLIRTDAETSYFSTYVCYDYPNCISVDLSRTKIVGWTEYDDWSNCKVTDISLPYTLKDLYGKSFLNANFSVLTCYATTPPEIHPYVKSSYESETLPDTVYPFYNCPELVVRVPLDAVPLYQKDEYWKNFTIQPIDGDYVSLNVNLMPVADASKLAIYKNMSLDLTNAKTGVVRHLLVNDRNTYEFPYLPTNTNYSLALVNKKGIKVASVDNIYIEENNKSVTFPELKEPMTLSLNVTGNGKSIASDKLNTTWLDANGAYLGRGSELDDVLEGQTVRFITKLRDDVAMKYEQPDTVTFVVEKGNEKINLALNEFHLANVTFNITEEGSLQGVTDAQISVAQVLMNGQAGTVQTLYTDNTGQAKGNVLATMSNIIITSNQYGTKSFSANLADSTDFNIIYPKGDGTTITVNWNFVPSVYEGETPSTLASYPDAGKMRLIIRNRDTYEEIKDYRDHSPRYTLYEMLPEGTSIAITAVSPTNEVDNVHGYTTVDSLGNATVTMDVVERGMMLVIYNQSEGNNPGLILFNEDDYNVYKKKVFDSDMTYVELANIPEGNYKVVAMSTGETYDAITNIDQLKNLTEGVDYLSQNVTMSNGINKIVSFSKIPLNTNTLTSNLYTRRAYFKQSQVGVGEYATVNVSFDFKSDMKPQNLALVFEVPDKCKYVSGSAIRGNKIIPSEYDNSTRELKISLNGVATDSIVRFCIVPQQEGEYRPNAYIRYTLDGEEHNDPLVTSSLKAVLAIINAPDVVNTPRFKVSGKSTISLDFGYGAKNRRLVNYRKMWKNREPNYNVEIMDGDEVIGRALTNQSGEWDAWVTLSNPNNLSKHSIWAKVTRNGVIYNTEKKNVKYDADAVVPKTLKMSFFNHHPVHLENVTVLFDYINDVATPSHYGFSNQEGYNTDFVFEADLSTNDTTKVYAVALYIHTNGPDAEERIAMCHYNKRKDRWVAYEKFNTRSLPYDVYVEPFYYREPVASAEAIDDVYKWYDEFDKPDSIATVYENQLNALILNSEKAAESGNESGVPTAEIDTLISKWMKYMGIGNNVESTYNYGDQTVESLTSEIDAFWDGVFGSEEYITSKKALNELGTIAEGITITNASGYNASEMESLGYELINLDNSSCVYVLGRNDGGWEFVDITNDIHFFVNSEAAARMQLGASLRTADTFDKLLADLKNGLDKIQDYAGKLADLADASMSKVTYYIYKAEHLAVKTGKELTNPKLGWFQKWLLEQKLSIHIGMSNKLTTLKGWLKKFKVGKGVGTLASVYALIADYIKFRDNFAAMNKVKNAIPYNCPNDQEAADQLRKDINSFANWNIPYVVSAITTDIISLVAATGCFAALLPTQGASAVGIGAALAKILVTMAANAIYEEKVEAALEVFQYRKADLHCKADCPECKCKEGECDKYPKGPKGPRGPRTTGDLDPSGFVYEGVPSNRVEGATATVYYKTTVKNMYGDSEEKAVLWNAEDFDQVNPQQTNENGEYGWMVPTGEWQVKYEKEGYQTVCSEWLPVPPPQLDVNQELRQYSQPVVSEVKATQDGVRVEFDKYMISSTLTAENISVSRDGSAVKGSVQILEEQEVDGQKLAKALRFVPAKALPAGKTLLLTVAKDVESYAKISMQENYSQEFDIVEAVESIEADSVIGVIFDQTTELTISALPAKVAAGKKVNVKVLSDMIASAKQSVLTLDANGQAQLDITGEDHGTTAVELSMADDPNVKKTVILNVRDASDFVTPVPVSNYESNSMLYAGSEITLECEISDAVIYYTVDGSCPCEQNSGNVYVYKQPIVITSNMTLKAIAVAPGYYESETREWNYTLYDSMSNYRLSKGWNWMTNNRADAVSVSSLGKTTGYVLDADDKKVKVMQPATAYRVYNTDAHVVNLDGLLWNARKNSITLSEGWNWLPYPLAIPASPEEALMYVQPQFGDVIQGEDGFLVYYSDYWEGDSWKGSLKKLEPGRAYRYKTNTGRSFIYNTNIADNSTDTISDNVMFKWYDRYAYANRMSVVAVLADDNLSEIVDVSNYTVSAEVDGVCRGNGYAAQGSNVFFINVLGDADESVTFLIHDTAADKYYYSRDNITFENDIVGFYNNPVYIVLGDEATSVNGVGVKAKESDGTYSVSGIKVGSDRPLQKGIYIKDGRKVVIK